MQGVDRGNLRGFLEEPYIIQTDARRLAVYFICSTISQDGLNLLGYGRIVQISAESKRQAYSLGPVSRGPACGKAISWSLLQPAGVCS